jgi:hypothetical protein
MNLKGCRQACCLWIFLDGMWWSMKDQKLICLLGEIQTGNLRNTNWNRYWSARFLAKTVGWCTYIEHAVYKLLVYFRQRKHIWSPSICTFGTIPETDFEGFEFIAARHSKWCSTLCLLNNISFPFAIFIMYVAELCWVYPVSWTTEYAKRCQ